MLKQIVWNTNLMICFFFLFLFNSCYKITSHFRHEPNIHWFSTVLVMDFVFFLAECCAR